MNFTEDCTCRIPTKNGQIKSRQVSKNNTLQKDNIHSWNMAESLCIEGY